MRKYFLLVFIFLGAAVWWTQNVKPPTFNTAAIVGTDVKQDSPSIQINNVKISVEIVQTQAEVEKGLSGRERLDSESGMLFVFSRPDYHRFWMPNMNFPIDIIWINQDRVAGISRNVPNDFDPTNPRFYTPPQPADRVLEVNAGFAASRNIEVNDKVIFNDVDRASPR